MIECCGPYKEHRYKAVAVPVLSSSRSCPIRRPIGLATVILRSLRTSYCVGFADFTFVGTVKAGASRGFSNQLAWLGIARYDLESYAGVLRC